MSFIMFHHIIIKMRTKSLLIIYIFFCSFLTSCSNTDKTKFCIYTPKIIDPSGKMPNLLKEIFTNFEYPPGIVPVLFYTPQIEPLLEIGKFADECYKKTVKLLPEKKDFKKRGMLIVISEKPQLIQIRLGNQYDIYCNMTGVSSGEEYYNLQKRIKDEGFPPILSLLLQQTSIRINEFNSISQYNNMLLEQALTFIGNNLEYAKTSSINLFGKPILKPIITILYAIFKVTENWILSLLAIFFLLFGIRLSLFKILTYICHEDSKCLSFLQKTLNVILGCIISLSITITAIILSSRRMEDLIALDSIGIPYITQFVEEIPQYTSQPSNLIKLIFYILFLFTLILKQNDKYYNSLLSSKRQQELYQNEDKTELFLLEIESQVNSEALKEEKEPYTQAVLNKFNKNAHFILLPLSITIEILPPIILYIGCIYSFFQLIYLWKTKLYPFITKNAQNKKEKMIIYSNIRNKTIISIFILLFVLFLLKCTFSLPEKSTINNSIANIEIINESHLLGAYHLKIENKGTYIYGSALIDKKDDFYSLSIFYGDNFNTFNLYYDKQNMRFLSNEYIGNGNIHHEYETNNIYITFYLDNEIWELRK